MRRRFVAAVSSAVRFCALHGVGTGTGRGGIVGVGTAVGRMLVAGGEGKAAVFGDVAMGKRLAIVVLAVIVAVAWDETEK